MPSGQGDANQGDDISGIVHEVGEGVSEFKKGDRVAAFHEMMKPGGSYAEYALSWAHTTFYLPEKTSFEGTPSTHAMWNCKSRQANGVISQREQPYPSQP